MFKSVEERDLVRRAHRSALGAGAVVAVDVDDQRVVELADIIEGLDHAPDLVVIVGRIGSEHIDLFDEQFLLVGRKFIPRLQQIVGPGRQLGILRDHAELLLVLEDALAQFLVAVVEQMHRADLVHPLLGRVVRRVRGARRVLDEDRFVRVDLMHPVHIIDRVVRHPGDEVPARFTLEGIDLRGVAEQVRLPLVGVAADKTVEVLEAHAGWPLVERSCLAGRVGRSIVVLAEPGRVVAVIEQDPPDRRLVLGDDAVVTREAGRLLGDHAEPGGVVVAAGDQGGASRRAQRGGEHPRVTQAFFRDAVHGWRRNDAAESARHSEAGIIRNDEQDVGRSLGRHDARRPPWLGRQRTLIDHAAEFRVGWRELFVADCGGGAGFTHHSGDLLGSRRLHGCQHRHCSGQ